MQKYLSKIYSFFQKKTQGEKQIRIKASLWLISCFSFLAFVYWGKICSGENQEVVYLREYFPSLLEKGKDSLIVVLFSLIFTVFLASLLTIVSFFYSWTKKKISLLKNKGFFFSKILFYFWKILKLLAIFPYLLSSIPLFITGIFLIRIFQLDTVHDKNIFYGVVCLSLFNLNYITRRTQQKIALAYQMPHVLYAHSLGLPESSVFRYYIIPSIIKDHFTILRELLPHLTIESVIIEYTFGYSALIRSLIDSILYQSWTYFTLIFLLLLLFLSFFNILFQFIENIFF